MNKFGVKTDKSLLSAIKVPQLREYAMINGISPMDKNGKLLSKDKLYNKIKKHFIDEKNLLENDYGIKFEKWNPTELSNMIPYVFERTFKQISTQELFDSLPEMELHPSRRQNQQQFKIPQNYYTSPHKLDISHRLPAGSKNIRKESGLTKSEKTKVRKELSQEIDYLSDLLSKI